MLRARRTAVSILALSLWPSLLMAQPVAVQELLTAIRTMDVEIKGAEAFTATLPPGSVRNAGLARIVIQQITRDMLQQRALAAQFNIAIVYNIGGKLSAPSEPTKELRAEMETLQARAVALQTEGGDPLKQVEQSSILTTLAGLQQRVLFNRYGVPILSAIHAPTPAPRAAAPPPAAPRSYTPNPPPAVPQPHLEIVAKRGYEGEGGYHYTEGQIQNLTSEPIKNLMVVANWYAADGTFITSDSAMVEYNPLMPGQTSPFKTMTRSNPQLSKFSVEFKPMMGSPLPTRDSSR